MLANNLSSIRKGKENMKDKIIKEAVIKILEILSTADSTSDVYDLDGNTVACQLVIDELEVKSCKELLARIDPNNQQLRGKHDIQP